MIFPTIAFLVAQQASGLVPPAAPAPDKTVLTVNGQAITAKQMEPFLWDWFSVRTGKALGLLVAVEQEAAKHKVTISEKEVDDAVQVDLKQLLTKAPPGQDSLKWLRDQGESLSTIQFTERLKLLITKLAALDFKTEDYVKVSTIVVRPKDETTTAVTAAGAAADAAMAALQHGDPWDAVVLKSTTDQRAAANHGELGWRPISEFPSEIKKDLTTIKLNGYTKPVQTPNGFQIFRVEARGKDAAPQEITELKERYLPQLSQNVLKQIQSTAKIETP
jgi:peptidyl-prolyl cis-trans isomerase SurA